LILSSYGYLNEQGKMLYGDAFPDGRIPLTSILLESARLGNKPVREEIYRIDLQQMTEEQIDLVIKVVARSTNARTIVVRESFVSLGFIPIRASMVGSVSSTDLHLFV